MWKMGLFVVIRGHPRSLKMATFDTAHTTAYECLLAFHSNYVSILHRSWDIARYWSKIADLNLPHLYLAPPLGVTALEFRRDFWHQQSKVPGLSYGVVCVILGLVDLVERRLVTDKHADKQTDRQTHDDGKYRAVDEKHAPIFKRFLGSDQTGNSSSKSAVKRQVNARLCIMTCLQYIAKSP